MLPKSERFTQGDFEGRRPKVFFRGEYLDIAAVTLPIQKFACVTAKKTFKRAVDRNLIKRRIFSVIKDIKPNSSYSIVFYPKKGSVTVPFSQLHDEIKKAFDTLQ